ncbi:MAG: D-alanyl-D-alanine carboxypeptidase family protein [Oscillospiraceae bacterium]|nr:D-alanyl-D-alanine carboxypeptidase family protein [Oscillospiraceae bacterium]
MSRKIFKRSVFVFFVFALLANLSVLARAEDAAAGDIRLSVNGAIKEVRPKILKKDGVIYFPVIATSKYLFGSFADYDPASKTLTLLNRHGAIFTNRIDTAVLSVNGEKIKIARASFGASGDFYATGEFLRVVFGATSKYDDSANLVMISQSPASGKLPQELSGLGEAMLFRHYQPKYLERYVTYKKANPTLPYFDAVTYVNIGLDFPYYSPMAAKAATNLSGNLVLCNKYSYLPEDYVPEGYKKSDGRVLSLVAEAQGQFDKMRADAKNSGINIYIVSGYRSYAVQKQVYENYKKSDPNGADTYSARPGHSEHQTGLAADLNSASISAHFENTAEYAWLAENAHRYGFILRYPKDKEWLTGYVFEPWHWRYVGQKTAEKIKNLGITFDEYHAIYLVPQNTRNQK